MKLFDWSLQHFITPSLIRWQYKFFVFLWIPACILTEIAILVETIKNGVYWTALGSVFVSLLSCYTGIVLGRMYAEMMILFFNIHDKIVKPDSAPPVVPVVPVAPVVPVVPKSNGMKVFLAE